ncbi:hypothetical protein CAMGR0001_0525 [Campylobacter gracilis RM3268]|uniref:Uncharacterized protein n=1 Tax=Campylobacter gracilis RM3268 TaxID=553220 RepID=C8PHS9_9BACT|nr:hypothetical protein CAMGR0001_0525 [Campylobacter gracilis RM3268]
MPSGELKFNQNFKGVGDLCRTTPTARSKFRAIKFIKRTNLGPVLLKI